LTKLATEFQNKEEEEDDDDEEDTVSQLRHLVSLVRIPSKIS